MTEKKKNYIVIEKAKKPHDSKYYNTLFDFIELGIIVLVIVLAYNFGFFISFIVIPLGLMVLKGLLG